MTASRPWNPSKATALLVGVATLWPPIYMIIFVTSIGLTFLWAGHAHAPNKAVEFEFFKYIFPLHCLTMFLCFALTAIYVVHAFKTDRFPDDKRVLWVIILFMGNVLAFPIYWWLYIRPGRSEPPSEDSKLNA
jgi:hypothetical protein